MKKNYIKGIIYGTLILVAFGVLFFQQFQTLGVEQIKIWDEARGAVNAIEMLQTDNIWVVTFDGEPDHWNTKSPLFVWLKSISYMMFGINEFAVRFPSAFFTVLLGTFLLFFSLKILNEIWTGIISIILLVNTPGFMGYHVARNGEPDTILVVFVFFYAIMWFLLLEKYPKKRNLLYFLLGTGFAMAVLTKSIAGIAPAAGLFVYGAIRYKLFFSILKDFRFYIMAAGSILIISIPFLMRELYDPGYLSLIYKREVYGMFVDYVLGKPKHPEFSFYFEYLAGSAFKKYTWFLLPGILSLIFSQSKFRKKLLLYNIIMALALILGYSASEAKNEWYIAPVYPFLVMIIAISMVDLVKFINQKLKQPFLKYPIILIFAGFLIWITIDRGINTYHKNLTSNHIYALERPGYYMRKFKNDFPEVREFNILTSRIPAIKYAFQDQMKFYKKKFFYEDSIMVHIINTLRGDAESTYTITTEGKMKMTIERFFVSEKIYQDNMAVFYYIQKPDSSNFILQYSLAKSWNPIHEMNINLIKLYDSLEIRHFHGFAMASGNDTAIIWANDGLGLKVDLKSGQCANFQYSWQQNGIDSSSVIAMAYEAKEGKVYSICRDNTILRGSYDNPGKEVIQMNQENLVKNSQVLFSAIQNKGGKIIWFIWTKDDLVFQFSLNPENPGFFELIDQYKFSLPDGYTPDQIIDIAIGGKDNGVVTLLKYK